MSSYHHRGNLEGQGATMEVIGGGEEIPLSAVRLCRMKVSPNACLDMSGSLHLTIGYLLKNEYRGLGTQVP